MARPTAQEQEAVRIEVGALPNDPAIPAVVIDHYWAITDGIALLTAARVCDWLAANIGRTATRWSADGASMDRTMQPAELRARAEDLRARYAGILAASGITGLPWIHPEAATVRAGDEYSN